MARVREAFLKQFHPMKEELHDPVIFVVDMINGFLKEGALHDKTMHPIIPAIQHLLEEQHCRVIFVADAHPPHTKEFEVFPPHCVIGTRETEVITELQPYVQELFHKNSTNTFLCSEFQTFLKERIQQYQDIVIIGCCSDLCILQFALSLQAWLHEHNEVGKRILLPIDCIDTYHISNVHEAIQHNEASIKNMELNGIHVVSTIIRG